MGSLRTLLALTVVLTHAFGAYVFVGGPNAVRMFYVISGFLISYVLVDAKTYATARSFYVNRILRLYPLYAVVALATWGLHAANAQDRFFSAFEALPAGARILVGLSNASLWGQDWLMFTAVHDGHLTLSSNFRVSDVPVYEALLVPQSWTLGLELTFYLLAPLIVVRPGLLYAAMALSVATRIGLLRAGLGTSDPWTYRFFPSELCLFLAGALVHQKLLGPYRRWFAAYAVPAGLVATLCLLGSIVGFQQIPLGDGLKTKALFVVFLLALPLLFLLQSRSKWDRRIGELSYPLYISHVLAYAVAGWLLARWRVESSIATTSISLACAFALAWALSWAVGAPVERLRALVRARSAPDARVADVHRRGIDPT